MKINDREIRKLKTVKPLARRAYGRISTVYLRYCKSNVLMS